MGVHARKTKIPIDTLEFFSDPTAVQEAANLQEPPESGVNIHGLFLQGCGWDLKKRELRESDKEVLFVAMPVIWLEPIPSTQVPKRIAERNLYECPIYKTSLRKGILSTTGHSTNFVKYLPLRQPVEDPSHWIT